MAANRDKPVATGARAVDRLPDKLQLPIAQKLLPAETRLSDLLPDYELFTLAIPQLLSVPWEATVLTTELEAVAGRRLLTELQLPQPVFSGLFLRDSRGASHRNNVLWLVPRGEAGKLKLQLGSAVFVATDRTRLYRLRLQEVQVYDLSGSVSATPGVVDVTAAVVEVISADKLCVFAFRKLSATELQSQLQPHLYCAICDIQTDLQDPYVRESLGFFQRYLTGDSDLYAARSAAEPPAISGGELPQ